VIFFLESLVIISLHLFRHKTFLSRSSKHIKGLRKSLAACFTLLSMSSIHSYQHYYPSEG